MKYLIKLKKVTILFSFLLSNSVWADHYYYKVNDLNYLSGILYNIGVYKDVHHLYNDVNKHKNFNKLKDANLIYPNKLISIDTSEMIELKTCNIKIIENQIFIIGRNNICPPEKVEAIKKVIKERQDLDYDIMLMTGVMNNAIKRQGIFEGVNSSNISFRLENKFNIYKDKISLISQVDYFNWQSKPSITIQNDSKFLLSGGLKYNINKVRNHIWSATAMAKSFNISKDVNLTTLRINTEVVPTAGIEYANLISDYTKIGLKASYGSSSGDIDNVYGLRMRYMHKISQLGTVFDFENFWLKGIENQEQLRIHFGLFYDF